MTDGITMSDGITMTNAVIECILSRSAAKYYDPAATLSDDQIRELVRIGTTAPTSFHLQNWRFIAVRTPEAKARLHPIAWHQPAITEARHLHRLRPVGRFHRNTKAPGTTGASGHHAGKDGAGLGDSRTRSVYGVPAAPARRGSTHRHLRRGGDDLCSPLAGPRFDADDRFRCRSSAPRVWTGQ